MGLSDDETLSVFLGIGLAENTAKQSLKNAKFARALLETIQEAGAAAGCDKAKGALLYMLASKCPHNALVHRPLVTEYIMTGKIASNAQLEGACDYLKGVGSEPYVVQDFEAASGVGVLVTAEETSAGVSKYVAAEKAALEEQRYHYNTNILLGKVRGELKWADMAAVKQEIDRQVQQLLGPKTEADMKPPEKKKKAKAEKKPAAKEAASEGAAKEEEEAWRTADPYAFFPKPEQNNMVHTTVSFSDGRQMRISNSPAKLKEHLAATGGKVLTRFPPEPNGYLHIGHAKAMFVDFGMAEQYGGSCYLRFDDTNPEAEKKEYIDHIQDIVSWMGWKPFKVTYSSDYFQELYDFAVQLIRSGNAYVCHQTAEEIKQFRERREGSPWRDRPIEESLKLFDDMRRGLVDEGAATLRMRMDPKNENFNMFDLIAYRIKFTAHPHAGDTWCIYPSYDYTHCLVDALENITHSLCTLEFESRRASYYWLLEVLDTYKPLVWEYARLNVTHTMLSKRKLNTLVTGGHVNGWDDPRLLTLAGLRRRGVRPQAINNFCREVGITRSEGEVPIHKLEHHIRMDLDAASPRALAVLRPLRVVITNLPAAHLETVEAKAFPGRSDDTYKVPFSRVVYIEATDFREQDKKDFFGLAPGKTVMLRYAYAITCTSHTANAAGQVTEVQAEYHPDWLAQGNKPPKGVLNWVAQPTPGQDPESAEVRLYDHLFSSPNPGELDNWLADINPASVQRLSGAFITPALASARAGDSFQFERLGYFCADADSRPGRLVFNRTATLRESIANKSAKK